MDFLINYTKNNTLTELGQEIILPVPTPFILAEGRSGAFSSYSPYYTVGAAGIATYFKYSLDGYVFSDWIESAYFDSVISPISVFPNSILFIAVKFVYVETFLGPVSVMNINFTFEGFGEPAIDVSFFATLSKSIFKNIFKFNPAQIGLAVNLMHKLYGPGIVPQYIIREGQFSSDSLTEDGDYISFWRTIADFTSLIVIFARTVIDFSQLPVLQDFLLNRGLIPDDSVEASSLLQRHFFEEVSIRGTEACFNGVDIEGSLKRGEWQRLIGYDPDTSYHEWGVSLKGKTGWTVDRYSPLNSSTRGQFNFNIGYLKKNFPAIPSLSFLPYAKTYDCITTTQSTPPYSFYGSEVQVLRIGTTTGQKSGIYFDPGQGDIITRNQLLRIDPYTDYELSFGIKCSAWLSITLNIRLVGYKYVGGVLTPTGLISTAELPDNAFIQEAIIFAPDNEWLFFNAHVLNYFRASEDYNLPTSLDNGGALKNANEATFVFLEIYAGQYGSSDIEILVSGIQLKPITLGGVNLCFLQNKGFLTTFFRQENTLFTTTFAKDFFNRYLKPFDLSSNFVDLYNQIHAENLIWIDEEGALRYNEDLIQQIGFAWAFDLQDTGILSASGPYTNYLNIDVKTGQLFMTSINP